MRAIAGHQQLRRAIVVDSALVLNIGTRAGCHQQRVVVIIPGVQIVHVDIDAGVFVQYQLTAVLNLCQHHVPANHGG